MKNQLNVWDKWSPLKKVVLGTIYPPEYFELISNPRIRIPLQQVVEETLEDLDYFEKVLQDYGVEVIRPQLDPDLRLDPSQKISHYGTHPLTPRDNYIVIGNNGYSTIRGHETPKSRNPQLIDLFENLGFKPFNDKEDYPGLGANIFPIGNDIITNSEPYQNAKHFNDVLEQIKKSSNNARHHTVYHAGHSDGGFHPIKPGAFLSINHPEYYTNTYPGWEGCILEGESWDRIEPFLKMKDLSKGHWWIPGQEDNKCLSDYIKTWLVDWVGYVEETVFDVNVLMLDESHMFVSNPNNPKVIEFSKKHGIELIHIPWRHRFFWDGGIHCITQELVREGNQHDYWPKGRSILNQEKPTITAITA